MANTVIALKKSSTPSSIPSSLEFGELAINYADGKLFYKNTNSQIAEISGGEVNYFGTVNANSVLIIADTPGDILTIEAGDNITIVGDAVNDKIIISAAPGGSADVGPAFTQANTARDQANAAFTQANSSGTIASAAFDKANAANILAFNTGVGANAYAQEVGTAGNNYTITVGVASNNWANTVASYANTYADGIGAAANGWVNTVGGAAFTQANTARTHANAAFEKANAAYDGLSGANAYSREVGTAGNNYTITVGAAANGWANSISLTRVTAANDWANTVASASAVAANTLSATRTNAANGWANTVASASADAANTYAASVGAGANNYANATFVKLSASSQTISGDVSITGNLSVTGNVTSFSANNLIITDPFILLANNNSGDVNDIGIVAHYNTNSHTGIFRSSGTKEWYVFSEYDEHFFYDGSGNIDISGNNFTLAVLNAHLKTSNLVLNGVNATSWITAAYNQANSAQTTGVAAFGKANTSLANTSGISFNGNLFFPTGNIGIGTTNPDANLSISNTVSIFDYTPTGASSSTKKAIRFNNLLYSGVMVESASGSDILSYAINTPQIGPRNSSNVGGIFRLDARDSEKRFAVIGYDVGSNTALQHFTVRLDTGNVGIGITAPTSTLHVIGTANITTDLTVGGNVAFDNINSVRLWEPSANVLTVHTASTERLRVDANGNVGIGTTAPSYRLEVAGSFAAQTKSFVIDHQTKPNTKLVHGSLEGPEVGVYVRGKSTKKTIEFPDYWSWLVDEETITVNLTPIGKKQDLFVKEIKDNKVIIGGARTVEYYYTVYAERKDVPKLIVECW